MSYCRGIIYIWASASRDKLNCSCSLHRFDTPIFATESRAEMLDHLLTHEEDVVEIQASISKVRSRLLDEIEFKGDKI